MVPPVRSPRAAGPAPAPASASTTYSSVKDLLEDIGKSIQKQAKDAAEKRSNGELQGDLSKARFKDGKNKATKLCELEHTKHTNAVNVPKDRDPCYGREEKRFSDERSGQCTYNRIKDSEIGNNNIGACAPYRRLHLCHHNLETIETTSMTTHDLLLEVCMAAKYEGQSIRDYYPIYQTKYNDYGSTICTVLARSFADIGDIIRGKDLYLGYDDEEKNRRQQLEENLKKIFANIYKELTTTSGRNKRTNGKKSAEAKKHYGSDENFFQLREDWWALNRRYVWDALTCNAPKDANYFEYNSGKLFKFSNDQCGHNNGGAPPTNLDYVPQFLRWFDEWSEDFCRKRKHKLKNIKDVCRNESKPLYCSLNGFDCTETVRRKDIFIESNDCMKCFSACSHYSIWVDNQKKEFEKQKKKYEKEIPKYVPKKDKRLSNINNEYYNDFYKNLKEMKYDNINTFLKFLNEGKYCKENLPEEEVINFIIPDEKKTFHRSKYCEPCPICGVKCENKSCTEKENDDDCKNKKKYDPPKGVTPIDIPILYSGDKQGDITKKLEDFCYNPTKENEKTYQNWKCYYKDSEFNKCKMESKSGKSTTQEKIISFDEFFYLWVNNLLIDSIMWENDIKHCINNTNVTNCNNGCNENCICFEKWVGQKEKEWENVKKVLKNPSKNLNNYYNKLNGIFSGFFFEVVYKFNNKEEKWNQFTEDLKKKIEASQKNKGTENSQDAIELLLDHLKDNAITCKDNNSLKEDKNCPQTKTNPCIKGTRKPTRGASNNLVSVKHIAELMQQKAHIQLEKRGGEYNLKGDATRGTYKRGGSGDHFKNLCSITKIVSNDSRNGNNGGPCTGKNPERFNIGTEWKQGETLGTNVEIYMPPRREHMCTSNLEKIDVKSVIKNGNASHSLLGDVLLAAKYEAKNIKELYQQNNSKNDLNDSNDQATVCRAMKYSFADIGDIIRGKDMWVENMDARKLQAYLAKIFEEIKDKIPDKGTKDKYEKHSNLIKLGEDWWEANRHQVWRAMKCATKAIPDMKCNGIPIEDYIPQRLRWMTEWAEWFCKEQSKLYGELVRDCASCKKKGKEKCTQGDNDCTKCKAACDKYKEEIEKWNEQWKKIKAKYEQLYKKALDSVNGNGKGEKSTTSGTKDEKDVVDFLKQLLAQNSAAARNRVKRAAALVCFKRAATRVCVKRAASSSATRVTATTPNTPYSTAAGYIHQELTPHMQCKGQTRFCGETHPEYAFKHPPKEYKDACSCNTRDKTSEAPVTKKEEDACEIVKELLKDKKATDDIDGCKRKEKYKPWNCTSSQFKSGHTGACMPPRRQKLCVSSLTKQRKIKEKEDIRTQFIKSAAIETHFAWLKYKEINTGADNELQTGNIPDEFKRQMFYTFGDYRDIFFGTDISSCRYIKGTSKTIKSKLGDQATTEKGGKHIEHNEKRQEWWKKYGGHIWEGMLCGLTHGVTETDKKKNILDKYSYDKLKNEPQNGTTPLEDFAKKPQFLRWMIEWGDEFCKKRKEQVEKLRSECDGYECNISGNNTKQDCEKACKVYQKWLQGWKENYKTQSEKYFQDKKDNKFESTSAKDEVTASQYAYEYLNKALQKLCDNVDCKCMDGQSNETPREPNKKSHDAHMPKSLDEEPEEVKGRCTCQKAPQPPAEEAASEEESASDSEEEEDEVADGTEEEDDDDDEDDDDADEDEDDEDDEETETAEEEEEEEKEETPAAEVQEETAKEAPLGPSATPVPELPGPPVNVCSIVKDILTGSGNLDEACKQKYGGNNSRLGWKCIPSGEKSGSDSSGSGAICVPPRRRRLYVGKLETLDEGAKQDDLRTAFIKCAAIETFFSWHEYKMEKKKEKEKLEEQARQNGGLATLDGGEQNPQTQLQSGKIPPDFLRLMFYTLGDYRDICVDNVPSGIDTVSASDSGDNPTNKVTMKEISEKIKQTLESDNNKPSGVQNGDKDPKTWWDQNAKHIWDGMVCALTYRDSGGKEQPPIQDKQVKDKLWDTTKNTPIEKYQYNRVKLEDESGDGPKLNTDDITTPTLTQFVERPPYFRYLEEWGQNFCKERKKRLEKIKEECTENGFGTKQKCSGYGEDCKDNLFNNHYTTFPDFYCPECGKHCSSYRKWIERKKDEYDEQKNAYGGQKKNCPTQSKATGPNNVGNGFCGTVQRWPNAAAFLQKLGPCKVQNGEDNNKIFDEKGDTFQHTKHCDPCSEFKINCEKAKCSGTNGNNCKGGKISPNDIKDSTEDISMLVSDDSPNGLEDILDECVLGDCADTGIFEGIRKDVWTCGNVCGYNVCKPENGNGKIVNGKPNSENQIIFIRALFKRWLEYFVQDYNKIKHRISHCINNGNGSICTSDCGKKCNCVEEWISTKKEEWEKIKEHYLKKNTHGDKDLKTLVTDILGALQPQTDVNKAIKPCGDLRAFERSIHCNGAVSSENDIQKDVVECLLDKLKKDAENCQNQPSGTPCTQTTSQQTLEEEDLLLEENENPENMRPGFCPQTPAQQEETDGNCEEAPPQTAPKEPPAGDERTEELPPPPEPPVKPAPASPPPAPADEPFDPTILQTTIPFGVALALGSIAFLFLKKKSKSSVGNLFQILQIPKSDYNIPTLKSSNRYIPYASDRHKGKTYIYMEGDSSGEEKYAFMSDSTDVTSSESEYEELDINDIYVPRAPKYKTLIEVVLEPSGNNTTASGNNTTDSGNNTPSDTQNDIPSGDTPNNKLTDNEWNTLKDEFISNMLQNQPNTEPNILHDNLDNNTHPTMSRDNMEEKPFITSIHDRNLYTGEEYNYNINMSTNSMDDPKYVSNNVYSGIDLINDTLGGNKHIDIYDEVLKRKENELFGTNYKKNTSNNSVAKLTNSDPILNQINLFHTWLDRHRDMCEKLKNDNERLAKLKEKWENETHSGDIHTSDSNKTLNTDVSIQIHMDNPKPINQFNNMDTILEDLDKPFNEPYYYDMYDDDIYYDVNDHDTSTVDTNAMDVPSKVQIEMDVNTKLVKEKYPIADVWDI
ncbi:erythrocyte membrane protein 1 [Plasmodium falciparum RAJ116]|uniref:Erythrocyte membrane protein 1 n=3 Tax=Plasmodium falciparum TaxID=5833 RepID=A0A0L0CRQ0_PLAFA|nr:erythrocyte membrane protein 1 [Plasmodium falciparum RAJ116]